MKAFNSPFITPQSTGSPTTHQEGVGVAEVKSDLLAELLTAGVEEVVTLPVHVVVLDVLDAVDEGVQLVKLVQGQIHLLQGPRICFLYGRGRSSELLCYYCTSFELIIKPNMNAIYI